MTSPSNENTRILVSASSFADAEAALRLIERVIHVVRPSLGGMLVEELTSLAVCELPNQRVISASGQVVIAPTRSQIGTLIEADARAFRKSLATLAERAGAPWTFQRDIGDLIQKGLGTGAASDILVFAHRKIHPVAGKIVLLSSATSPTSKMTDMSKLLAQQLSTESVIMAVDGDDATRQEPSAVGQSHFNTLKDALSRLARLNAQAVLVDFSHGPARSPEDFRALIDAARCPVFVFGTVSDVQALEHSTQIPPVPPGTRSHG